MFPELKIALKGYRFSDSVDIQGYVMTTLKNILKEVFQLCSEQSKDQFSKCLLAHSDYFMGDRNYECVSDWVQH